MKTRGTPLICLEPMGNMQGPYNFLSLSSGFVIKQRWFDELRALASLIKRVATLSRNNDIYPNLIFMDQYKAPFDWPDNDPNDDGLDPTPITTNLDIHAEMPGVLIDRDALPTLSPFNSPNNEPDWSQLANEAAMNAGIIFPLHLRSLRSTTTMLLFSSRLLILIFVPTNTNQISKN